VQNPDAVHPTYLKSIALVDVASDGLLQTSEPLDEWRNESDCGVATFKRPDGSIVPLNCAAPRRALIKDVDGSFLGGLAGNGSSRVLGTTLHGGWRTPRHASGYDQSQARALWSRSFNRTSARGRGRRAG
jgi:hypothetical protein